MQKDLLIIRELAKKYAEAGNSQECKERIGRYKKHNSLNITRPIVLVFEEPWGEFSNNEELLCKAEDKGLRGIEWFLRSQLFKWKYFQGDYIIPDFYGAGVHLSSTDTGIRVEEKTIQGDTGSGIMSHIYKDSLSDEEALEKIKIPEITYNEKATQDTITWLSEIFSNIMPVKKTGVTLYIAPWDTIPRCHGVENTLCDLYDRPEFMHKIIERFTQINEKTLDDYERLNVLEKAPYYLHCTPALTDELPSEGFDGLHVRAKDVWFRGMAQIFSAVSPEMHEEFDILYAKRLADRCGLSYYGCCEPLDTKIDVLRQIKNLRKVSITPWANPERAAEAIGKDYVLSFKANPAFVACDVFDPEPVEKEIERILKACIKNSTPCEIILKDISTVNNKFENLTKWVETVNNTIDRFY